MGKVERVELQKARRKFWRDGYIHYLDCVEPVHIYQDLSNCILSTYTVYYIPNIPQ